MGGVHLAPGVWCQPKDQPLCFNLGDGGIPHRLLERPKCSDKNCKKHCTITTFIFFCLVIKQVALRVGMCPWFCCAAHTSVPAALNNCSNLAKHACMCTHTSCWALTSALTCVCTLMQMWYVSAAQHKANILPPLPAGALQKLMGFWDTEEPFDLLWACQWVSHWTFIRRSCK